MCLDLIIEYYKIGVYSVKEANMGKRGREIIDLDLDELISELNKALADEWLAYYQYWLGARIAVGPMRGAVTSELQEHAEEELKHADMLAERIIQLGGTPLLSPKAWYDETNCGYNEPKDPDIEAIINQNLEGERCAIDGYQKLLNMTQGKDHASYQMLLEILNDELEHEEDLESFLQDMSHGGKK